MKTLVKTALAVAVAAALGNAQAADLKAIGVSVSDLGNPFFVQVAKGVEAKAKELGGEDATVTVVSTNYDLSTQMSQIDNFIAAGVDIIVLNAADPKGIFPAVMRAKQEGIVVIAVDVAAEGADATVTSNNTQAGELACQYMADRLEGKGNVVIVNGPPVSAVIERVDGCKSVLANFPDINILSDNQNAAGSREGGLTVMTSLLAAYPDINAVFAINDPSAVGADLAARQAQRDDFFIVSVDGAPSAEEALKQEGSLIAATSAQNPQLMARRGVEIGLEIMNGNLPEDKMILIPTPLVTRENVGEYAGWTAE
jgi:ribose transport system substrate-binding protein